MYYYIVNLCLNIKHVCVILCVIIIEVCEVRCMLSCALSGMSGVANRSALVSSGDHEHEQVSLLAVSTATTALCICICVYVCTTKLYLEHYH